jgi:competence ComEA-like helix-hairpin-helix protein
MKKIIFVCFLSIMSHSSRAFQPVDINRASPEQIALLPGVGAKLSQRILEYRTKHGLFKQEQDLLAITGITSSFLEKIRKLIIIKNKPDKENLSPTPKTPVRETKPIIKLADLEKIVLQKFNLTDTWETDTKERTRRSAALPEINLLFDYDRGTNTAEKRSHKIADTQRRGGHEFGFGLRATFDLGELIFHKSELEITSLALKRLDKREEVLRQVRDYYFDYLRTSEQEQFLDTYKLNKLASALDSLSNNAFSRFSTGEL